MSDCTHASVAASSAVKAPIQPTAASTSGVCWKRNEVRKSRYTPAVTMVAAWMRAETGVGPSIASGSQTWNGNWADLPAAPR